MIGDIRLDSVLTLKNVLYVPTSDMNLISISDLTRTQRFIVYFTCSHALIQDIKLMKMIGKAENDVGLYMMGNGSTSNKSQ